MLTPWSPRRMFLVVVALLSLAFGPWLLVVSREASANSSMPGAQYGAVQLAANVAKTIPTGPMSPRQAIAVQNLGPTDIYCAWNASVTTATGWKVAANGGTFSVDTDFNSNIGSTGNPATSGRNRMYCITTVLQVSPADTRWMEIN